MRRLLAAPLLALTLAAAGCGGDDEPAGLGPGEVGMNDLQFTPRDLTVKVGTTVTWINQESIPHNVVAEEGADFESDTFGKDGTYEFRAEEAGVVRYVCTLHPGMAGTLSVEE